MKVRDLLGKNVDIDCYADDDSFGICFCGPLELTDEGYEKFQDVMSLDVVISDDKTEAYVDIPNDEISKKAKEFFYAAAGYCSCSNYDRWFIID